jgi:hypothetical protein
MDAQAVPADDGAVPARATCSIAPMSSRPPPALRIDVSTTMFSTTPYGRNPYIASRQIVRNAVPRTPLSVSRTKRWLPTLFQCPDSRGIDANIFIADDEHLVKSLDRRGVLRPNATDPHVEDAISGPGHRDRVDLERNAALSGHTA